MSNFFERLRNVTPTLALKWASVLFVICLYVLMVVSIILAIIGYS